MSEQKMFEVWEQGDDRSDADHISATDAESAAMIWAKQVDADNGYTLCNKAEGMSVCVACSSDEDMHVFVVLGEVDPVYLARQIGVGRMHCHSPGCDGFCMTDAEEEHGLCERCLAEKDGFAQVEFNFQRMAAMARRKEG